MRVTIERPIYSKLQTRLSKDENADLREEFKAVEVTFSPKQDAILWDPPVEILKKVHSVLLREQGFMRKPDSASFALMTKVLDRLEKLTADAPN